MDEDLIAHTYRQEFPSAFLGEVRSRIGNIDNVRPLAGMGKGHVWQLSGNTGTLVLKRSACHVEAYFYREIAPRLAEVEISTPGVYFNEYIEGWSWLALEYIPHELPRSRWHFDEEIVRTIARLHSLSIDGVNFSGFNYCWPVEFIENGTQLFPEQDRDPLLRLWLKVREEFIHILECSVFVSGDPSGKNWASRANGELVLLDWERAGFGTPAIDLMAVAFDQLPHERILKIADCYLRSRPQKMDATQLAHEIKAGRAYIISEILSRAFHDRTAIPQKVINYLTGSFSAWLSREFKLLGAQP